MTKRYSYLLGLGALLLAGPAAAQAPAVPLQRTCGTQQAEAMQQQLLQKLVKGYDSRVSTNLVPPTLRTGAAVYTMPVIVHVINNGEAVGTGTNISQAQINSQIDVLNEDYRNLNTDGATVVPSVFQPLRSDAQLQFVMATRDPNGNPLAEPGIDRVSSTTKGFTAGPYAISYIDGTIKPNTYWNPEQYINIWVMNLGSNLLGYAQFPDNTANLGGLSSLGGAASTDGVVILYIAFGSRAKVPSGNYGSTTNPYDMGRTLTHELGHFFGLRHVWGDANCGNDYVADTPTQQTSNYGCPTFPHVTCSNGPNGDLFVDYMDYVNDRCMAMFSGGQVARFQAVMAANTPRRTNLTSSPVLCSSAVAATATGSSQVCAGGTISLQASGPAGATYAWTGPNGYTSSQPNPTITSATAAKSGTYSVTVSQGSTCPQAAIRTVAVAVSPVPPTPTLTRSVATVCPGTSVTLSAGVPAASTLPSENFNGTAPGWTLANAGTASTAWQLLAAPYSYASSYLTLSSFSLDGTRFALANSDIGGNGSTTNTTITSPVFSTVGHAQVQLQFQQVFRYQTGDQATVEASTDGTNWTTLTTYASSQGSATAPAATSLDLSAFANQPSVQVRWHYLTSWSYYWAIDNVQVTDPTPTPVYTYTVVSGDGLPSVANTPTIVVSPTVNSVYQLTVSYAGSPCTSSATVAVAVAGSATWNGSSGDGNWFNAANWTGCVPNRSTDATIPAGLSTPYPTVSSGTAEVRTLTQRGNLSITGGELAFYGDYLRYSGTLLASGGTVSTRGTGNQFITSGAFASFVAGGTGTKNLSTPSGFQVTPASVSQSLTMAGAILYNDNLTLAPTATLVGETDASYVLGRVLTTHSVGTSPDNLGNLGATIAASFAPGATTVARTTGTSQGTGANQSILRSYAISAATSRGLQGATLTLAYLPHELNGNTESQLAFFKSADNGASFTNEGFTARDATARTVSRSYVTSLNGTWTLANATSTLANSSVPSIQAFPVPFDAGGLSVQITTNQAGPLSVQLYDVAGRKVIDQAVANVEVGTSTVNLLNSGQLAVGKYILRVQQGVQSVTINVSHL